MSSDYDCDCVLFTILRSQHDGFRLQFFPTQFPEMRNQVFTRTKYRPVQHKENYYH